MKKLKVNQRIRGFTLIEIFISMVILLLVLGMTYYAWNTMRKGYNTLESHTTLRQELKKALNSIYKDVSNSSYLYANQEVTVEGVDYKVGDIGIQGQSMLMAIPENPRTGSVTYTMVGYYLKKNTSDKINTDSYDLVRYEISGIKPPTADSPASIDLSKLSGGTTRVLAKGIDSSLFSFTVGQNGKSLDVTLAVSRKEIGNQTPSTARISTTVNLRNI